MSNFSSELREELLGALPQKPCCKRALLMGLLINAECGLDMTVYFRLGGEKLPGLACSLLSDIYGRSVEPEYSTCYGKTIGETVFASEKLYTALGELSDPENVSKQMDFFRCKTCRDFFCAGLMLSSGSVSDPERESRAEIRVNDPARASRLCEFFYSAEVYPTLSARNGSSSLMFKSADSVECLLAMCGANNSAMQMMQFKMVRELRGDINRKSNCEINNIVRTTGAAASQIEAISRLRENGKFTLLSEELKYTAGLRESYPEATLGELAAMHNPPITKSGLNHRMEKITALAKKD